MQNKFNNLIDTYLSNKIGISSDFLSLSLTAQLRNNIKLLSDKHQFAKANIGNNDLNHNDLLIRSDQIYWLDRKNGNPSEDAFLSIMDQLVIFLNETCFTGIVSYEFHYAIYEIGDFYLKHLDQFKNDSKRAFTIIIYLNEDWKVADGGELCIFDQLEIQLIPPTNQKCVFFKSNEIYHSVLTTQKQRLSIAGWLKVR
ncbi:MAG: 2OG-Fe(II) oxygenase [Saprospiraceae bacterium]|nr:2OG-Fe(II) oxygenase [Saprospiraceae bacterium]